MTRKVASSVTAATKEEAHRGKAFFADPASPWINEDTCGICHVRHVDTQWTCLMMTESGKMQGTAWGFGALEGYTHVWGNYDVRNQASPERRVGSNAYRAYMQRLKQVEPGAYPDVQMSLPEAPTDLATQIKQPGQAAFTYQRAECRRCHLAVRGRQGVRGDYRGMGCSACHIPYSDAGLYEGHAPNIPKDKPGHLLVHSIQSTRKTKVAVGRTTYTGIPLKTCGTCHNRGKRIGVSFQGLMESAFTSPATEGGGEQIALHGKRYIAMHEDKGATYSHRP